MAPDSIYNLLQSIRELLQRASSEGLMPFMLAGTNGTPSKKNTIRLIEVGIPIFLFIIGVTYYGGKIVQTLEHMNETQIIIQESIIKSDARQDKAERIQNVMVIRMSDYLGYNVLEGIE